MICPHDGGFAIKFTEKIEDLISVLFLPLYFALSGLNTNLGALNDSITWGYVIGVIVCAFSGKIIGGTLAARANKLFWRESFTIGCLMSCKGLVELIVLVRCEWPLGGSGANNDRILENKLVSWMKEPLRCLSSWHWLPQWLPPP